MKPSTEKKRFLVSLYQQYTILSKVSSSPGSGLSRRGQQTDITIQRPNQQRGIFSQNIFFKTIRFKINSETICTCIQTNYLNTQILFKVKLNLNTVYTHYYFDQLFKLYLHTKIFVPVWWSALSFPKFIQ